MKYRWINVRSGAIGKLAAGVGNPNGLFNSMEEARTSAEAHSVASNHAYDTGYEIVKVEEDTMGAKSLPWKDVK